MRVTVLTAVMLVSCSLSAFAGQRVWEDAKVLRATTSESGAQAIVIPMGAGTYGAAVPSRSTFFWLQTHDYTYVIPSASKGVWVNWWLHLTIGGTTKISVDGATTLHIIDDTGKERKVSIFQRIANSAMGQGKSDN